jgi:hypothetical protein
MNHKQVYVTFAEKKLENEFELLREGKFEDKRLYEFINRAIGDLKIRVEGTKIEKRLWPKIYIQKYDINNLFKYDLPNGWRLIYTIKTDEVMILNVILEWFDHKEYEKRFKY